MENKSYEEVMALLRRPLNKYEEGENRFQTLTNGTKDEAETEQNRIFQAKTEEVERVNLAEPDEGNLNITSSEKKTQGRLRMNIDARLYNKGARCTRYLHS